MLRTLQSFESRLGIVWGVSDSLNLDSGIWGAYLGLRLLQHGPLLVNVAWLT